MRKDLQYLLRLGSSGAVSFRLWRGGATSELTSPAGAVSAGTWSHVVATFDGASMAIYVNGTVRATLAMAAAVDAGTGVLSLGSSSSTDWFRGRMDEVAVYGTALPGPRVLAHYTKSSPVEDPPPTVVLESPAPGSTADLRPVFAGTADGETLHRDGQGLLGRLGRPAAPVQTLSATHQTSNLFSVAASGQPDARAPTRPRPSRPPPPGSWARARRSRFTVQAPSGETVTIAAAGDIADCGGTDDEATANLLDAIPGTVMTLGDNAYVNGTASEYACYNSSWGRHKARTRPIPGDHDYGVPDAGGYFDYFGAAAGPRPVRLLQLRHRRLARGGAQLRLLRAAADLQRRAGRVARERPRAEQLAVHARPAPRAALQLRRDPRQRGQRGAALADPLRARRRRGAQRKRAHVRALRPADARRDRPTPRNGIRQFTVGTGGESHYQVGDIQPNSQVRESNTFGVLKMTLRPDRLRLAVRAGGGQDLHGQRHRFLPLSRAPAARLG